MPKSAGKLIRLVSGVTKTFRDSHGDRLAVADLTIDFEIGSCLAFMGSNACGKTTGLRMMLGLESADSGQIGLCWNGCERTPNGLTVPIQGRFGTVIQQHHARMLLPNVSVKDNLLLPIGGAYDNGLEPRAVLDRVVGYLRELGYDIPLRAWARTLSGGQQQAVVLARALAFANTLLIWDEPTSWLDMHKRLGFYRLLQKRRSELRLSMILVTHDVEEALLLADRVMVFDPPMLLLADVPVLRPTEGLDLEFPDSPEGIDVRRKIRAAMMGAVTPKAASSRESSPASC